MTRVPLGGSVRGISVVDLLFAMALTGVLASLAVPFSAAAADEFSAGMAARYVANAIMDARMRALSRSSHVGIRFERAGDDYAFATYLDGNYNGVRNADIASGTDRIVGVRQRLGDRFRGVRFGLGAGIPDADGGRASTDGVRIGSSRILTTSPDGTATSGTLYVQGRRGQYAVRVLGATGRTRVLRYDTGARRWTGL